MEQEAEHKQVPAYSVSYDTLLASAMSGIISRTLLHPIDTIKARVPKTGLHSVYGSSYDALTKILRFEGPRGLYRGLLPSLLFSGPAQTLYLTTYEAAKVNLAHLTSSAHSSAFVHISAGFIAEAISCVVWVPHDVIKERMQIQRDNTLNMKTLLSTIRADGVRNLYKGYWITLGTFGPYSALYFYGYERMKDAMAPSGEMSFGKTMVAASLSSTFAAICTTPLDVIKTRFQVQRRIAKLREEQLASGAKVTAYPTEQYNNMIDAMKKIIKSEGPTAFWKGITARVLYSAPNAAIIMSFCKQIFSSTNMLDELFKTMLRGKE